MSIESVSASAPVDLELLQQGFSDFLRLSPPPSLDLKLILSSFACEYRLYAIFDSTDLLLALNSKSFLAILISRMENCQLQYSHTQDLQALLQTPPTWWRSTPETPKLHLLAAEEDNQISGQEVTIIANGVRGQLIKACDGVATVQVKDGDFVSRLLLPLSALRFSKEA